MTAPSARSKPAVVGLFRSRLAVRIYLVGLAQFFLVAVGLVVVARERRPSLPSLESLRFVADSVASVADDPEAVATTLASAEKIVGTRLAVFDDAHRWVAGTVLPPAHRMGNDHPPFPPDHPPPPPPFGPPPDGRGRHPQDTTSTTWGACLEMRLPPSTARRECPSSFATAGCGASSPARLPHHRRLCGPWALPWSWSSSS